MIEDGKSPPRATDWFLRMINAAEKMKIFRLLPNFFLPLMLAYAYLAYGFFFVIPHVLIAAEEVLLFIVLVVVGHFFFVPLCMSLYQILHISPGFVSRKQVAARLDPSSYSIRPHSQSSSSSFSSISSSSSSSSSIDSSSLRIEMSRMGREEAQSRGWTWCHHCAHPKPPRAHHCLCNDDPSFSFFFISSSFVDHETI